MGRILNCIPNIKVSYHFSDIIRACFITSRSNFYTNLVSKELSSLFGGEDVILTSSGRSALYHILSILPQKKVYIPAYTCDVVIEAAVLSGKDIIYVHVDRETLNIVDIPKVDSNSIIIATHQYGFPCKIKEICETCKQKGAVVIEDCAGALGTKIDGQLAGTFGDFAIFSFNASKLINAPSSGGFLIAKNNNDLKALRARINYKPCSYKYKAKNLCKSIALCCDKNSCFHYWLSRLTRHDATKAHLSAESYQPDPKILEEYFYGFYNWQAYVVLKQLKLLSHLLSQRKKMAKIYQDKLSPHYLKENFYRKMSCIRYPIYLRNREETRLRLRNKGVEIGFGFEHFVCPDDYADEILISQEIAYLPYSSNFSEKEINYIVSVLNADLNEQGFNT